MRAPHRWKYESDSHDRRCYCLRAVLGLRRWHLRFCLKWMERARIAIPRRNQSPFRGLFPPIEALVGPHVSPVSVPPAVGDTLFIEIAMNRGQSRGSIEIEDHIGIAQEHRLATQHAVVFAA